MSSKNGGITIREPLETEYLAIYELIRRSFEFDEHSDHSEQDLVRRLTGSPAFIPGLCLAAFIQEKPVGYILITRAYLDTATSTLDILSLAPVCVDPEMQGQGIGAALIRKAIHNAELQKENGIVLIGHASYYPRFGFKQASNYEIRFPFEIPDQFCMALPLSLNPLPSGTIRYPAAFYS